MMKRLIMAAVMCCVMLVAVAQSNIDKAIAELENDYSKVSVICTEKRNPETKKTYKVSKVVTFVGKERAQKIREAIIKDSKNAVEYTRADNRMFHVIFRDGACKMEYVLQRRENNDESWIVTVELLNQDNAPSKSARIKLSGALRQWTDSIGPFEILAIDNHSDVLQGLDWGYINDMVNKAAASTER